MKRVGILSAALAFLSTLSVPAWASDAHEGGKAALPQLDVTLYPGLLFWLAVCFFAFFIMVAGFGVPGIRKTQAKRKNLVSVDLNAAKMASEDAQKVMDAYEAALADARAQAQKTVNNIIHAANAEATEEREKQAQELSHRFVVAEENINAARVAAMKEVPGLVPALVRDIMAKLTGPNLAGAKK